MGWSLGNSSAITVSVAPAAFPIRTARWPADLPIARTMNHRLVVMASVMRLFTSSTPQCRAVWNPKVLVPLGRGRSLSMVFGTWATLSRPPAASATF